MPKPLTPKHAAFVAEYRSHRNATRAYTAVYGTTKGNIASANGARLLRNDSIKAALAELDAASLERMGVEADEVLRDAVLVLRADARGLSELRVGCCRYCYGDANRYQRTTAEFNTAYAKWSEDRVNGRRGTPHEFDEQGGIGWDPRKPPLETCPECVGEGVGRIRLGDTRNLTPEQVALYDGVKATKEGIQMLTRSRDAARETLMKHLGLYAADNKQKAPPLVEAVQALLSGVQGGQAGGRLGHTGPRALPAPAAGTPVKRAP